MVEAFHVLAHGGGFIPAGLCGFGPDGGTPDSVDRGPRFTASEVRSVVGCFPSAAVLIACFRADPDEAGEDAKVAELAILFRNERGGNFVHLGWHEGSKFAGFPERGHDVPPFLAQVADVPGVDAVVGRGLGWRAREACFLDLLGSETWKGLAVLWRQELVREYQRDPTREIRVILGVLREPRPPEWREILSEFLCGRP